MWNHRRTEKKNCNRRTTLKRPIKNQLVIRSSLKQYRYYFKMPSLVRFNQHVQRQWLRRKLCPSSICWQRTSVATNSVTRPRIVVVWSKQFTELMITLSGIDTFLAGEMGDWRGQRCQNVCLSSEMESTLREKNVPTVFLFRVDSF